MLMVRNWDDDLLPYDGTETVQPTRFKCYGYFPLATPLYDSDMFFRYCAWCVHTLGSDPNINPKELWLPGLDRYPNATGTYRAEQWCLDEILTDEDIAFCATTSNGTALD
jgi:hypothetical protein